MTKNSVLLALALTSAFSMPIESKTTASRIGEIKRAITKKIKSLPTGVKIGACVVGIGGGGASLYVLKRVFGSKKSSEDTSSGANQSNLGNLGQGAEDNHDGQDAEDNHDGQNAEDNNAPQASWLIELAKQHKTALTGAAAVGLAAAVAGTHYGCPAPIPWGPILEPHAYCDAALPWVKLILSWLGGAQ